MSSCYRCSECGDWFLFRPDPCPTCARRQRQKQRATRAKEKRGSYDLTGQIAAAEFWQLLHWYPCCPCCGKPWPQVGSLPAQDHIIPISRGGPNTTANLQPLCQPCNLWKSDHLICFDGAVPGQAKALPQRLWPSFQRWLRFTEADSEDHQQLNWLDPRDPSTGTSAVVQQLTYPFASPTQLQAETLRLTQAAILAATNSGAFSLPVEPEVDPSRESV
ncbi:MAG: HNH endonuclease signature motif containing protein [Thermostichus sp. HHBFW_bins_43]